MNNINWNEYAQNYDVLLYLKPYQQLQQDILKHIRKLSPSHMLDAACGTGTLLKQALASNSNMEVHGVDYSKKMLIRARKLIKGCRTSLVQTNLNKELPYKNNFFDLVSSVNTLYALENPEKTLLEIIRVLKPGGTLILSTPKKGFENGLILKEHCQSTKPDSYWLNVHMSRKREWELLLEAVPDKIIAEKLFEIAHQARTIHTSKEYHFFSSDELSNLLSQLGMTISENTVSYAKQAILITSHKGENR